MIFPREIQQLHSHIAQYLDFAKFENTSECFDHEIQSKIVTNKLENIKFDLSSLETPELLRMLKGVSREELIKEKQQKNESGLSEKYIDLLAGARQLFNIAVKMTEIVETSKSVTFYFFLIFQLSKKKEIQAQVKATKNQLTRYHTLVFPETKPQYQELISEKKLKNFKKKFVKLQKQVDLEAESETNKLIKEVRESGLVIKPDDRPIWISEIIKNDIFSLQKNEDIQLNLLTSASSATLGCSLAVFSMVSSTIEGANYLFKSEKFPAELSKLVKRLEHNSVSQRFCISVLQKLSYLEKPCTVYHRQDMIEWALEYFEKSKKKPIHSFNSIYLMSMLYNVLSSEVIILEMGKNLRLFSGFLSRLLKLLEVELPVQCYSIILNILLSQKKFNVKYEDLQLEGKLGDTAQNYLEKFEELFKGKKYFLLFRYKNLPAFKKPDF